MTFEEMLAKGLITQEGFNALVELYPPDDPEPITPPTPPLPTPEPEPQPEPEKPKSGDWFNDYINNL